MTFCDSCGLDRDACKPPRCSRCLDELAPLLAEEALCIPCSSWLDLVMEPMRVQAVITCRYPRGPFPTLETA